MTGPDLLALRKRLGLSQVKFAERLGVSQGFIGDLERGRGRVHPWLEQRASDLTTVPAGLCGSCLCVIAGGICGCPVRDAA